MEYNIREKGIEVEAWSSQVGNFGNALTGGRDQGNQKFAHFAK